MVSNYIEMVHVLGLKNNPFLGGNPSWQLYPAIKSLKERYKDLKEDPVANLNFSLFDEHSSKQIDQIISKMSDGEYVGFGNYWYNFSLYSLIMGYGASGHAYSLHVVKRSDQTHFIYFNRGQRHYDKSGLKADNSDSVLVFSINPTFRNKLTNKIPNMVYLSN